MTWINDCPWPGGRLLPNPTISRVNGNFTNGKIFCANKCGSTAEYAAWIAETTGLPTRDIDAGDAALGDFDFLVLGCPVIYHKLMFSK